MALNADDINVKPYNVTWDGEDLGYISGDINVTPAGEDIVEITAHQTGTTRIAGIRSGRNIEDIELTLLETSPARLQQIFAAGSSIETIGSMPGVDHVAIGIDKLFQNVLPDCKKLVFHPVGASPTDYSQDLAYWLAYPVVGSMVFSGENANTVTVTFKIYPDNSKLTQYQFGVFGDHMTGEYEP